MAELAVPHLDALRPHVGRALSLSAKVRQARTDAVVMGLELTGVGAAVITPGGKLRAANHMFEQALGSLMIDQRGAVVFEDRFLQETVASVILQTVRGSHVAVSMGLQVGQEVAPLVVHLIPLKGRARDVCGSDGVLLLIARVGNEVLPNADLLRLLFDLTPAESRVARCLAEGMTLEQIAAALRISSLTVRTQLRSVFSKTGVRRQADLVRLLVSIRPPSTTVV